MVRFKELPTRPDLNHFRRFHPTMVRFKVEKETFVVTVAKRFHPTMVRFKAATEPVPPGGCEFPSHYGAI